MSFKRCENFFFIPADIIARPKFFNLHQVLLGESLQNTKFYYEAHKESLLSNYRRSNFCNMNLKNIKITKKNYIFLIDK